MNITKRGENYSRLGRSLIYRNLLINLTVPKNDLKQAEGEREAPQSKTKGSVPDAERTVSNHMDWSP